MHWLPIAELKDIPAVQVILVTDGASVVPAEYHRGTFEDLTAWNSDGYDDIKFSPTHFARLPMPPAR